MSILVRPVREQLEHDRVIRLLQAKWKKKFDVEINVGDEHTTSLKVGQLTVYPDLVLHSPTVPRRLQGVVEVETGESVNHLEAMAQWTHMSRARAPFQLYVPTNSIDQARRLCAAQQVALAELWSYYVFGEQVRLTLVHRDEALAEIPQPPKGAIKAKAPKPAPAPKPAVAPTPAAAATSATAAKPAATKPVIAAKSTAAAKPVHAKGAAPSTKAAPPRAKAGAAKGKVTAARSTAKAGGARKVAAKVPAKVAAKVTAKAAPRAVKPSAARASQVPKKAAGKPAKPVTSAKSAKSARPAREAQARGKKTGKR